MYLLRNLYTMSTLMSIIGISDCLQTKYSYLDVVGRTVVVLEKKNAVPGHNVPFQVISEIFYFHYGFPGYFIMHEIRHGYYKVHDTFFWQVYYTFKPIFMLAEPLMLASAFFLFFIACVAYLHIDLSIRK